MPPLAPGHGTHYQGKYMPERVHQVLAGLISRYLEEPWRWPREEDLLCEMVSELGREIRPNTVPIQLSLPSRLVDRVQAPRASMRIRREVKLVTASTRYAGDETKDDGGNVKQKHDDRIDVGVFKDTKVEIRVEVNGPRDVLLRVRPEDVAALIEVKVYPEHYFQAARHESPWLEDVRKLHALDPSTLRCVVVLDTSVPLETAGVTWRKSPRPLESDPSLPPWPLKAEAFELNTIIRREPRKLRFAPCSTPSEKGTYLYAPALRPTSTWRPLVDVAIGCVPLISPGDMTCCCWQVSDGG